MARGDPYFVWREKLAGGSHFGWQGKQLATIVYITVSLVSPSAISSWPSRPKHEIIISNTFCMKINLFAKLLWKVDPTSIDLKSAFFEVWCKIDHFKQVWIESRPFSLVLLKSVPGKFWPLFGDFSHFDGQDQNIIGSFQTNFAWKSTFLPSSIDKLTLQVLTQNRRFLKMGHFKQVLSENSAFP